MAKVIFNGEPGETFTNDTGKVQYQLIVQFQNSCGLCIQFAHAVGPHWPVPFHRACRCVNKAIWPGETSQPFVDFREEIRQLEPKQQAVAVGAANWRLVESGTVKWDDVVTKTRVRSLREVVSRQQLSVADMLKAGVKRHTAESAHTAVNTPHHAIVEQHRRSLIEQLRQAGLSDQQIKQGFGERMAARVAIREGPSGPQAMPAPKYPVPLHPLRVAVAQTAQVPAGKAQAIVDQLPQFASESEVAEWIRGELGEAIDLSPEAWDAIRKAIGEEQAQRNLFKKLGIHPRQN